MTKREITDGEIRMMYIVPANGGKLKMYRFNHYNWERTLLINYLGGKPYIYQCRAIASLINISAICKMTYKLPE